MGLFKKEILIGDSIETAVTIMEQLKEINIPHKLGIKDVVMGFEEKDNIHPNYTIKVPKKYLEHVEALINQHVPVQDIKQEYLLAKKKSKKIERKESFINFLQLLVLSISLNAIYLGKRDGVKSVSYIAITVLFLISLFLTEKYGNEFRKVNETFLKLLYLVLILFGITLMGYACYSLYDLLR